MIRLTVWYLAVKSQPLYILYWEFKQCTNLSRVISYLSFKLAHLPATCGKRGFMEKSSRCCCRCRRTLFFPPLPNFLLTQVRQHGGQLHLLLLRGGGLRPVAVGADGRVPRRPGRHLLEVRQQRHRPVRGQPAVAHPKVVVVGKMGSLFCCWGYFLGNTVH